MASYTDATLQFSPFVSQMPLIQERSIVGREKQAKYEEGVQRIQSSIDNVAGLDVFRPVDKQYLQSKLDELGNNLKTVAAGDFSNFQLQNSVGGMVKSIANDKILLDKVSDTARYKRDVERMQADVKEGKDNPANTLDFQNTASNWLDGDLQSSYSGRYLTPRDVWKKIKDVASSIGVNSEDVQNIFQTDSLGNPVYREVKDKTGKVVGKEPIFNDIAVQKITKGKDPEAMLRAFQNALTPDDFQQLSIDGKYRYANYSPEELKVIVATQYDGHIRENKNRITNIELQIASEKNKGGAADMAQVEQLEKLKQYYEQADLTYKTTRDKNIESVDIAPGAVRGSLYTSSYLETMSKALSPKETTIKYEESPSFKVKMEVDKFNEVLKQNAISNQFRAEELALAKTKEKREQIKFEREGAMSSTSTLLPKPTDVEDINAALRVEDNYSVTVGQLDGITKEIALAAFRTKENNKSLTDRELEEKFNREAMEVGRGNTPEERRRDHMNSLAQAQLSVWKTTPPLASQRGLLDNYNKTLRNADVQKEYIQNVEKEALAEATSKGVDIKSLSELKKQISPVTVAIKTPQGNISQRLSAEDILDFAQNDEQSQQKLMIKFGTLYENIKNQLKDSPSSVSSLYYEGYVPRPNPELIKAQNLLKNQNYKTLARIKADIYKRDGAFNAPTSIAVGKWEEKESGLNRNDVMNQIIDLYGGENSIEGYDGEKMKEIIVGDDSRLNVYTIPGTGMTPTKYIAEATSKDGKNIAQMFINEREYVALSKQAPPTQSQKNEVAIKLTSRNITGDDNYEGAFFQESDFPSIDNKVYSVTGNYEKEGGNTGNVYLKLYIKDKQKGGEAIPVQIPIPLPLMTSGGGYNSNVMNFPLTINTADVSKLIKNK